jgi:hypothetical protein
MARNAFNIIEKAGLGGIVCVINSKIEDVCLPGPVDVLVLLSDFSEFFSQ